MNRPISPLTLPTPAEVSKWLKIWDEDKNNPYTISSMRLLFATFPQNDNIDSILVKISALDNLYSTNAHYLHDFARHIHSIPDIDTRLSAGDVSIVDEIACTPVTTKNGQKKIIHHHSLSSKFCAFSNPSAYYIYDSYVKNVLTEFNRIDSFSSAQSLKIDSYKAFDEALNRFQEKYHDAFANISKTDLDKYLWIFGKTAFPKYSAKKSK